MSEETKVETTAEEKEPLLTEREAFSVLKFANAYNNGISGISGLYTPDLLNQSLKMLNNDAQIPDYDSVIDALISGMNAEERLKAYTEWMEWADMIFKRTIEYYANMLSFDLTITCKNAKVEDYNSKSYKRDEAVVYEFLDNFDYKDLFRKMVRQMLRTETAFTWLRNNEDDDDTKFTLQMMPQSRCLLTGYFEDGLIYDFDMNYFLQPGISIDEFDPVFKQMLAQMFSEKGIEKYIPTNPFDNRDGIFAYTVQTSPCYERESISGAWAFKFDTGNFNQIPFLSGLLKDSILNIPIQKLQYDKDVAGAYALLVGEIGMLDSSEPNATEFDPVVLGELLAMVRNSIGKYVKVGAMPTKEVEWRQFKDENTSMYQDQLGTSAATGAAASRIIYSTDKMSQEEIRNAILTDYQVVRKLYPQFEKFLGFYVNKLTKKFKFNFSFDGSVYTFERKDRQNFAKEMLQYNIAGNDSYFASLMGIKPTDFRRMLEQNKGTDWMNQLPQIMSVHTQSGNSGNPVGAPVQEDVSSESREYDKSNST